MLLKVYQVMYIDPWVFIMLFSRVSIDSCYNVTDNAWNNYTILKEELKCHKIVWEIIFKVWELKGRILWAFVFLNNAVVPRGCNLLGF